MDVTLEKHSAKHVYKVPEGLRELCTDISREGYILDTSPCHNCLDIVLRSQPRNIYDFIAEYVDTLLITRENTKVAVKVVNNILLGSQAILGVLYRTGLSLEQIAVAAPRIQKAFRDYLDAVDMQPTRICGDETCDERSKVSIRNILEATGASFENAEKAATIIQAAFRGHYERMSLNEARGKVQWQKAVVNTLSILKKAGATQAEISKASRLIQYAYRGYYTRRNRRMEADEPTEEEEKDERIVQPGETIQAVAWLEMMYEDSGLTPERANEAALIIQRAYKRYRVRRSTYDVQRLESTKSMVVEAILENLRHRIFERVMSREDIPEEYGTREDMTSAGVKLEQAFKDHLRQTRISVEGHLESVRGEDEEWQEDEEASETETTGSIREFEGLPVESESEREAEDTEEQSAQLKADDQQESEFVVAAEPTLEARELEAAAEKEPPGLPEESRHDEKSEDAPPVPINAETTGNQEMEEHDEHREHENHEDTQENSNER